jgi:hypothetical protein
MHLHHRTGRTPAVQGRRISRRLLPVVPALVLCLAVAAALDGASAATLNVTGTWNTVYHCMSGCSGDFPDTFKLTQAQGSATVTGTDEINGTVDGSLSGNTLTLTETDGSYTAHFDVTLAANGASWSGTLTDSNGTSGTDTATLEGSPVVAKTGEAAPVSGTVLVKLPGQQTFAPLTSSTSIPIGATIDATSGTVAITTALPGGKTQTGDFYDGEFKLTQAKTGLTTETLAGGDFAVCSGAGATGQTGASTGATTASASTKTKVVRSLWGNAHGKYTTSGRAGAATVLGTIWLTEDECDGTLFKAVKDSITVVDFAHPKQRHVIAQGHSYLALLPGS